MNVAGVVVIVAAVPIAVVGCIFCVVVAHCVGVDTRAHRWETRPRGVRATGARRQHRASRHTQDETEAA